VRLPLKRHNGDSNGHPGSLRPDSYRGPDTLIEHASFHKRDQSCAIATLCRTPMLPTPKCPYR